MKREKFIKKVICIALFKKVCVLLLMLSMLARQQPTYAQAQPVANFVVNRAVAGVIVKVAASRGFAANDARIAATMAGASNALTAVNVVSTVAGVGLAVAGAPVWLTIVGGLAVLAVGSAIVAGSTTLSITNAGAGNKLQISDAGSSIAPPYTAPPAGSAFTYLTSNGQEVYRDAACFSSQDCYVFPPLPAGDIPIKYIPNTGASGPVVVVYWSLESFKAKWSPWGYPPGVPFDGHWYTPTNLSTASWTSGPSWDFSGTSRRLIGNLQLNFQDPAAAPSTNNAFVSTSSPLVISSNFGPQAYPDLDTALPNISPAVKAKALSNATLAQIVNKAWQNAAAQPNYTGLPYSVTTPVTDADVATWRAENPMSVPTIGDLLTPANAPNTTTVPISPTVTASDPNPAPTPTPTVGTNVNVVNTPNVNVVNKVSVDLGPDPGIAPPTLESTPTAQMILDPLLNLFPSLRNFVVPSHASECPKPVLTLFGRSMVLDGHCTLMESVRPTLYAVMAVVWVVVGLFIVLAA
jgi:hypothetical protein